MKRSLLPYQKRWVDDTSDLKIVGEVTPRRLVLGRGL